MTDSQDAEILEDEIARTRARIDARLANLTDAFSPSQMIGNAIGVDAKTSSEMLNGLIAKSRENPLAALMVGIGVAGFMLGDRREAVPVAREDAATPPTSTSPDASQRLVENSDMLREQVSESASELADGVSKMRENAATAAQAATATASAYVSETAQNIVDDARRAPTVARSVADDAVGWVKENPVPAGLFAIAAGAVAASLFTVKRPESRLSASRSLHRAADVETGPKSAEQSAEVFERAPVVPTATSKPKRAKAAKSMAVSNAPQAKKTTRTTSKRAVAKKPTSKNAVSITGAPKPA